MNVCRFMEQIVVAAAVGGGKCRLDSFFLFNALTSTTGDFVAHDVVARKCNHLRFCRSRAVQGIW